MRWLTIVLLVSVSSAQTTRPWNIVTTDPTKTNTFVGPVNTNSTLNNVCVVSAAQTIAACIAALPSTGGDIYITSAGSPYSVALDALTLTKSIKFTCENPKTTTVQFTGGSGTAFLFQYGSAGGDQRDTNSGIENCTILGPGGYAGIGNAGTGIQVGTATSDTFGLTIRNTVIAGFAIGLTWPSGMPTNGSIMTLLDHDVFTDNTQEVVYTASSGPALTQVEFRHVIFNQQSCGSNPASLSFTGTAGGEVEFIDSYFNCEQIVDNTVDLMFTNPFFENSGAANTNNYLTIGGGLVTLNNPNFLQDQSGGPVMANFASATAGNLTVHNWRAVTGTAMTSLFNLGGTAQATLFGSRTEVGTFSSGDLVNTSNGLVLLYDKNGRLALTQLGFPGMLISNSPPTIFSGFGTSPAITNQNGTAAFTVNVGTGGTANSGIIALQPASATGWNCIVNNQTATSGNRADNTVQTASNTTSATIQNQTKSTGAAVAWTASDNIVLSCFAR